ncbi:MAG: site-2 protease family protein [Candidatus Shapirobacteria bacterium]|nr:site-2 protease family protein [Candidatus Shapirobacteria bacterium]MDD5073889.1 site-2 protease family protein [Candidatus Shapirobacteria bacterium]MDD5481482.1 site-2 protease family protein [Candidatus Shapirobacteria bacterium]
MLNFSDPFSLLVFAISLLFALSIHEAAHAWTANRLGDPTAKFAGRLTINPLAHLDPMGTILLIFFGFGWGKPVPVDEFNLDNPRRDSALISLAGPGANLAAAILGSLILWLTHRLNINSLVTVSLMLGLIRLNVILGIFNLLPLHPLDGNKILTGFLPSQIASRVEKITRQHGILLLIFAFLPIFSGQSLINIILTPMIGLTVNGLLFWTNF